MKLSCWVGVTLSKHWDKRNPYCVDCGEQLSALFLILSCCRLLFLTTVLISYLFWWEVVEVHDKCVNDPSLKTPKRRHTQQYWAPTVPILPTKRPKWMLSCNAYPLRCALRHFFKSLGNIVFVVAGCTFYQPHW